MMNEENIELSVDGPVLVGSSPELLTGLLRRFDAVARAAGCPIDELLLPPVRPEQARLQLKSAGLTAIDEVVVWYGWRNGGSRLGQVLPNMSAASLEDALRNYSDTQETINSMVDDQPAMRTVFEGGQGPGWLPLRHGNRGLAIYCGTDSAPPRIRIAAPDYDDQRARAGGKFNARSLCTLVSWWVEAIESEALTWDESEFRWTWEFAALPESQRSSLFI